MEKKSIIIGVVIVLLIAIIGVTIFFVNKNTINNSQSGTNNAVEDKDTKGPEDPVEEIPSDIILTPTENYVFTQ